ncbi:MAG: SH3 domain-containing protein [Anaerolineae bacterium]
MRLLIVGFLLVVVCAAPVLAQEDCPAIVQQALETARNTCADLGRDQVCYGNIHLEPTFYDGMTVSRFEEQGDRVDLNAVESLQLSAMEESTNQWGIALLNVHANLDEASQNVMMVLFGQVQITDARTREPITATATPIPTLTPVTITANGSLNVRGGPSTNQAIIASLAAGDTMTAVGRNSDGSWLHIGLEDGSFGWVFAQLVTVEGDANALPIAEGDTEIVTPEPEPVFGPMQSFYLNSGLDDSPCEEAPDSGILIQTPQGVGQIELLINEVYIRLGSTAYIQAQPSGEMVVSVVEGQGQVEAVGVSVNVPAGSRVRVPLDANGIASGPPIGPEPYVDAALAALPVSLLPQQISIAAALTEDQLSLAPLAGMWGFLEGSIITSCNGNVIDISTSNDTFEVVFEDDGVTFVRMTPAPVRYTRTGPGLYAGEYVDPNPNTTDFVSELTVLSPELMTVHESSSVSGCARDVTLNLGFVGEAP